jgi:hypothetical protein
MIATTNVTPRFSRRSPSFTIHSVARPDGTDAPLWDDPVERATRRASWNRRQASRRMRRDRGQHLGLLGAVLALLLMLAVSVGRDTNPLARADARHRAELQQQVEQVESPVLARQSTQAGAQATSS